MKDDNETIGISPRLMTPEEAAAYCRVGRTVFNKKVAPRLHIWGLGHRTVRYDKHELDAFLDGVFGRRAVNTEAAEAARRSQRIAERLAALGSRRKKAEG